MWLMRLFVLFGLLSFGSSVYAFEGQWSAVEPFLLEYQITDGLVIVDNIVNPVSFQFLNTPNFDNGVAWVYPITEYSGKKISTHHTLWYIDYGSSAQSCVGLYENPVHFVQGCLYAVWDGTGWSGADFVVYRRTDAGWSMATYDLFSSSEWVWDKVYDVDVDISDTVRFVVDGHTIDTMYVLSGVHALFVGGASDYPNGVFSQVDCQVSGDDRRQLLAVYTGLLVAGGIIWKILS